MYRVTIVESSKYPTIITTVSAKDDDKSITKYDETIGYNKISYLLTGVYANLFTIDNKTGEIKVKIVKYTFEYGKNTIVFISDCKESGA
jgi:hypothetical protein